MKHFFIYVVFVIILLSAVSYAEEIAIIANKAYPANSMSLSTLREIYRGEKATEGNIRIKPFDQKSHDIRNKFFTKVLGTSEDGYNAYWIKKVFQEDGIPPVMKSSSMEVIMAIREENGGIGFIWRHEGDVSGIKILLVIDVGE